MFSNLERPKDARRINNMVNFFVTSVGVGAGGGVEIVTAMVIINGEDDTHFRLKMDGRDIVFSIRAMLGKPEEETRC